MMKILVFLHNFYYKFKEKYNENKHFVIVKLHKQNKKEKN